MYIRSKQPNFPLPNHLNIVVPGNRVLDGPRPDGLEVAAGVQGVEVRPVVVVGKPVFGEQLEREDANVALAHQVGPQSLDAVVCFC